MRFFSRGYVLIKGGYVYWFLIFLKLFNFLFLCLCIKDSNYLLFERGLCLFKGLCLLFLPNVPGAMFIQGGTFIPDSRVTSFSWFMGCLGRASCTVHFIWKIAIYRFSYTLESGINVPPWINIAPGTFGKNNKYSPLNKRSPLSLK